MKKGTLKRVAAVFLAGGFLLGSQTLISFAKAPAKTAPAPKTNSAQNGGNQNFRGGNRRQFNIKPVLDKLVKAKTITAAQESKIIAYENKRNADRTAQMQKLRDMSPADRQAYMAKQFGQNQRQNGGQNGFRNQNQYADLVKNKTITQKQADAISKAIAAARPSFRNGQNPNLNNQNSQNN